MQIYIRKYNVNAVVDLKMKKKEKEKRNFTRILCW